MPTRLGIVALVFGLAFSASLQAQEQTDGTRDGADHEQEFSKGDTFGIPIRIIEDSEASKARERRERESEQREKENLVAQQGMNAATQAMNKATQSMKHAAWVSAFFVAVGTGLLVWTLLLTRAANRAAQAAVQVTRETGRDQTRAYVEVSEVKFLWGTPEGDSPQLKVVLKNHGNTPAKWFQIRQGYSIFDHQTGSDPLPATFEELPLTEGFGRVWNGINPRDKGQQTQGPDVSASAVQNCWRDKPRAKTTPPNNTHGILVFGEIRYCTIFEEVFRSQFLFGAATLECFEAEGSVEYERYVEGSITYTATTKFEKAKKLTRLPTRLKLYQPEG